MNEKEMSLYDYMSAEDDDFDQQDATENTNLEHYLTFRSDGLTYAIDTLYVTEIITNYSITTLPMVPAYIKGIINLRGLMVPILDIRSRMGKSPADTSRGCCIIVLDIFNVQLGIIIDEVCQVVEIDQTNISPMPANNHQELVSGMITLDDNSTVLIMDCVQLVCS